MSDNDDMSETQIIDASINLYSFKRTTAFQSTVMTFLTNMRASQLELERLAKFFKKLDTDQDGYLVLEDFQKGCKMIAKNSTTLNREPDWHAFISSLDVNQDQMIDYNEFVVAAYDRISLLNTKNIRQAFDTLDTNQDGCLTVDELKAGFAGYMVVASDKEWIDMVSEVDKNGDGVISYKEF
jgi:calcium-dependent protein kinase